MFDQNMSMDSQVKVVTESEYYQLQNVRKITLFLSIEAKTVMHCLVNLQACMIPITTCTIISHKPTMTNCSVYNMLKPE